MAETTFGGAVLARRKELGSTQKALAEHVLKHGGTSITPAYLNDIEHDRRSPATDHTVGALAKALGLDRGYLFVLAGRFPPEDVRLAAAAHPGQVLDAVAAFRRALTAQGAPAGRAAGGQRDAGAGKG